MIRPVLAAFAITAIGVPVLGAAQDYQEEQPYAESQEPQVDVSVDLAAPGAAVSFDTFHDSLAPYGDWTVVGSYGRVWRPHVAAGWRPYYYGRWVWSDEGWLWVSDEPWGWGPYHYGRWAYEPYNGWFWVPGYQWAPAWVSWRFSGAVIGWAPLFPGVSVYVTSYPVFYSGWTFVPCARFHGVPVHSVAYAPSHVPSIFHATSPAPPRATIAGARAPAWGGPSRGFVEQRVGHPIAPARIMPVASPSQASAGPRGGAIPVYRPEGPRPAAPAGRPSHPGWGSPSRPGWGPPGRVPAPGAAPGSRPNDNRPGWGTPPSRGPAPAAPGPRGGSYAPGPGQRGGSYEPAPRGGSYAPRPGQRGGSYEPAPRGGSYAPRPGQRGGSYEPAPPASRGGGRAEPRQAPQGQGGGAPHGGYGYGPGARGSGNGEGHGGGSAPGPRQAPAPHGGGRGAGHDRSR